jgi:hypothetical protein
VTRFLLPAVGVAVVAAFVVAVSIARRDARRLAGPKPDGWVPAASFTGSASVGRVFLNVPGGSALDASRDFVRVRALAMPHMWIAREAVSGVRLRSVPGPAGATGIAFESASPGIDRIVFVPERRGKGREVVLRALTDLGWPVRPGNR